MKYVLPPSVPPMLILGAVLAACNGLFTRAEAQTPQRPSTASHITPAADTTWPIITSILTLHEHIDRSVRMSSGTENDTLYARAVIVGPGSGVSREAIAKYLTSVGAHVSAQTPLGRLILRIDRLRPDYSSHIAFVDSLAASPLFDFARSFLVDESLRSSIDGADGGLRVNSQGGLAFCVWGLGVNSRVVGYGSRVLRLVTRDPVVHLQTYNPPIHDCVSSSPNPDPRDPGPPPCCTARSSRISILLIR